jgi:2-succinyl-5-enolpyruvyl-6-hydroxy-3-cyclohexene-1-carboxylate synthase
MTGDLVFCVLGDLSFFYDQNALWNQNLRGNLRILLLNNGKGGIFNMLPGLEQSPARDRLVAAEHHTTAAGICQQNGVDFRQVTDLQSMHEGIGWLVETESEHPLLLEVLTSAADDERVLKAYYRSLSI